MTTVGNRTDGRNLIRTLLFITFISILLTTVASAQAQSAPFSSANGTLNASIAPTKVTCTEAPCIQEFNLTVTNTGPNPTTISLYELQDGNWSLISNIGNTSTKGNAQFAFNLSLSYNGLTTDPERYAVVSDTLGVKEFTIIEDWTAYETKSANMLALGGYIVAPLIAITIIVILSIVVRSAERRSYGAPSEYTDKSLFRLPEGESLKEKLASLLINPIAWGAIVFLAVMLIGLLAFSSYPDNSAITTIQILVISFVAAAVVPVILMTLAWFADIVDRKPLRFIVGMFMWGVLAAFIAFFINSALLTLFGDAVGELPLVLASVVGSLIISPVIEETIKSLGLSIMSQHHDFKDALDGLLYGFAIGVGFAMLENWFYFIAKVDPFSVGIGAWISVILYRSLFNTLAHGCFTGLAGVLLGMLKSRERFKHYFQIALLPGVFIAILLHIAFNFTAYLDIVAVSGYKTALVSFNPSLVVAVAFVFLIVYSAAVWDSRKFKRPN